jgi:nickel-dependent lactate racemase
VFRALHRQISAHTKALDVLVALGTHQPMTEEAICARLEISIAERQAVYPEVKFFNHAWDNPAALKQIGTLTADEVSKLTDGLFSMDFHSDQDWSGHKRCDQRH